MATGGSDELILTDSPQRTAVAAALVAVALATPASLLTAAVARAETKGPTSSQDALNRLDIAARLNPFAAEPVILPSTILQLDGKRTAALDAAAKAAGRDPRAWTAWVMFAEARRGAGNRAGARVALNQAAMLNPRAPQLALMNR